MTISNNDIQEKTNHLFSAILLEQQKINALTPPASPEKSQQMQELLDTFGEQRGRPSFYHYMASGKGHGPFTQLIDGSTKYDLIGGIGVNLLGHSHPLHIRACLEAAAEDSITCGNLQPYPDSYHLMQSLLGAVKDSKLKHFWFAGSGSFANDTALKMIWQKTQPKYGLIAFKSCFAGRSIATQDITDNPNFRQGMPSHLNVFYAPHFNSQEPDQALSQTLQTLDTLWKENGESIGALTLELIQGEGGFIYGDPEYYQGIFNWAKERELVIWVDEVQTFGRTYELFAFQAFNLQKYVDIVTVGKALQCCGVLYSAELNPKPGLVSGTFHGSLAALKASKKTIDYLTQGNFYGEQGRIKQIEQKMFQNFAELQKKTDKLGYYGGVGTMISFEVGNANKEDTMKFLKKLLENGIVAFSAGRGPVRVRFLLPVCLTDEHIAEIFGVIEKTLNEVF